MLKSLCHPNITQFVGVRSKPLAIIMEYEYFAFIPFGLDHRISNLKECLHTLDRIEGETFKGMDRLLISLIHNNAKRIDFSLLFTYSLLFFRATKNVVRFSHENAMMRLFFKRTSTDC